MRYFTFFRRYLKPSGTLATKDTANVRQSIYLFSIV